MHLALDLKGSGIVYEPGDCLAVLPQNTIEIAERIASFFSGNHEALVQFFCQEANLCRVTRKLSELLGAAVGHHVVDVLEASGRHDLPFSRDLFLPLLPRLYSIASAHCAVGEEAHLVVKEVRYHLDGKEYEGTASSFLCSHACVGQTPIPIYLHKTAHFVLPREPATPLIMVGPGTGIAPFRAFMQHKEFSAHSLDHSWLFFGEQHEASDFFYEDFWKELAAKGLKLDCAFSRDQKAKVYVQHKMWEKRQQLWQWLEEGAHLYVCGKLDSMAKDVEKMITDIIAQEGSRSRESAHKYLHDLHASKRYIRDVY